MQLNAKQVIGVETDPATDGEKVGRYMCENRISLSDLEIDVRELAPEDLVSTFVNAMLHALRMSGIQLTKATAIRWLARFQSEADRLQQIVEYYVEDEASASPAPARASKTSS